LPATDETANPSDVRGGRISVRAMLIVALVAVGVYGLDQLAKFLVVSGLEVGDVVPVLGELLQLHFVTNSGAAFSLASGFTWVLSLVAVGVIGFIIWFARRIQSVAWAITFGLVLGGAFGNVTDRLFREPGFGVGHVVDFIQIWGFPAIFNVADIAVVTGMGLFLLLTLRGVGLDGKRHGKAAAADDVVADDAPAADDGA
jgi:signal peptidase II